MGYRKRRAAGKREECSDAFKTRMRRHFVANADDRDSKPSVASGEHLADRVAPATLPRTPIADARVAGAARRLLFALAILPTGEAAAQFDREPQEAANRSIMMAENDDEAPLTLSNPANATLTGRMGTGTIWDAQYRDAPIITGTLRVGETLTANTSRIVDSDGMENATFTYRWWKRTGTIRRTLQNGADATYVLQPGDAGDKIIVRVSFTDDAGNPEWRESEPTAPVQSADSGSTNSAATGAPTISGTAQVGETLTASTSGINDANGLDNVSYSYQWIRSGTDISGETGSTYELADADEGETIAVRVSFTDDAGNSESLTSAATGAVAARPNTAASGLPTISGTVQVGETLTASTSGIADEDGLSSPGWTYQWIRADGSNEADIAGATGSTYELTSEDEGKTIKVEVTFTDDGDTEETLTSAATAAVAAAVSTAAPSITSAGSFTVDENTTAIATLTATDEDTASGDLSWSIDGGADASAFSLTGGGVLTFKAGRNYESPDDGDADGTYEVTVEVSDGTNVDSADIEVTLADVNEAPWAYAGADMRVRNGTTVTLRGTVDDPDSPERMQYVWTQTDTSGHNVTLSNKNLWPSFTAPSGFDGEVTLEFTLRVTDDDGLSDEDVMTVTVIGNTSPSGLPTISGTVQVGETLTASTSGIADEDGLSSPGWTYQWIRADGSNEADIAGATGSTYELTSEDEGKTIKVEVTFTDDGDTEETLTSAATAAVAAAVSTAAPSITSAGSFTVDENTTAIATLTATDEDTASGDLSWSIDGGADASAFSLTGGGVLTFKAGRNYESPDDGDADGTYEVTVEVSDGTNVDSADIEVTLADVNEAPWAYAGADMRVRNGTTVTLRGTVDDPDSPERMQYVWTQTDTSGHNVTLSNKNLWPSFTAPSGFDGEVTLEFTLRVTDDDGLSDEDVMTVTVIGNTSPSGLPTISGTVQVGETLTASTSGIADEDGLSSPGWTYQWIRADGSNEADIAGATGSTYELTSEDEGKTIKVEVTFTDDGDTEETLTSAATAAVAAATGSTPEVSIAAGTSPVTEGTNAAFTLSRTGDASGTLTVAVSVTETGAMLGGAPPAEVTFAAGAATAALNVATEDDEAVEDASTVTAALAAGDSYTMAAGAGSADVTAEDDDAAPVVTTASPLLAPENGTEVATLEATDADTAPADLAWSITGGADAGKLAITEGGVLAFGAEKDFEVPDDADGDGDYELTVQVTDGVNPTDATLTVRLVDVDEVAPALSAASVDGTELTLSFNEVLDESSVPGAGAFSVTVEGAARTVDDVSVAASTVTLTLASAVAHGEVATVGYTVPSGSGASPLQDAAGNAVAAFSGEAVTNETLGAPESVAAYSITSGKLEVRWSTSDFAATKGFKLQWKSGSQEYDSSRQLTVPWGTHMLAYWSWTETSRRYKYVIGGLNNGTEYAVRVIATNANGESEPSPEASGTPQSTPGQPYLFIENEHINIHGDAHPWLRRTWNHIKSHNINVEFTQSGRSWVIDGCYSDICIQHGFRPISPRVVINRNDSRLIGVITHELAHIYMSSAVIAPNPAEVAIGVLYFQNLLASCHSPVGGWPEWDLFADGFMVLVHGDRGRFFRTLLEPVLWVGK